MGLANARLDDRPVGAFVLEGLPARRCEVLEVGAGRGRLAAVLRRHGHEVTAIDPVAVPGTGVIPVALEHHRPRKRYDAAVANRVLHHLDEPEPALDHLASLLRPGGRLLVHEYDPDLLDERTADWYLDRWRRAGRTVWGAKPPPDTAALVDDWRTRLADLHRPDRLLSALRARFAEMGRTPACHFEGILDGDAASGEAQAIQAGAIRALGYRWLGARR